MSGKYRQAMQKKLENFKRKGLHQAYTATQNARASLLRRGSALRDHGNQIAESLHAVGRQHNRVMPINDANLLNLSEFSHLPEADNESKKKRKKQRKSTRKRRKTAKVSAASPKMYVVSDDDDLELKDISSSDDLPTHMKNLREDKILAPKVKHFPSGISTAAKYSVPDAPKAKAE